MILPPHQTERFYRIWWALLNDTNAQRRVIRDLPPITIQTGLDVKKAVKIRDALWADDGLREQFIQDNPANLSPADLDIVASWQDRLSGDFFILKHLKKHSIFLSQIKGQPARAYAVLGLLSSLAEVIGPYLPVLVKAVLLPFEEKIIYDGILQPYSVMFGPGIRADLNDQLRDLQEREGVITNLLSAGEPLTDEEVRARDAKMLKEFRKHLYKSGLSPKMVEQHAGNIEGFAQEYLMAQTPPRVLRDIVPHDVETYLEAQSDNVKKQKAVLTSFKRFLRFLWDTGRMDPNIAYDLQDIVKLFRR